MVLETLPSLKTEELNTRESVHLLRRVFPILLNETFVLGATPRIIGREPPSKPSTSNRMALNESPGLGLALPSL